jgi:hypothetical protein
MRPRRLHPKRGTWEYHLPKATCAACPLRGRCTRAKNGRTIHRHAQQELLDRAREHAHGAQYPRRTRQAAGRTRSLLTALLPIFPQPKI